MNINTNFLIPISLKTDVADLWYFKLWLILGQIVKVWYIKGLR